MATAHENIGTVSVEASWHVTLGSYPTIVTGTGVWCDTVTVRTANRAIITENTVAEGRTTVVTIGIVSRETFTHAWSDTGSSSVTGIETCGRNSVTNWHVTIVTGPLGTALADTRSNARAFR